MLPLVVNGNDFDVFAPGYIDSFVTNVMVTANGDWELVEPTALPLREMMASWSLSVPTLSRA